MSEPSALETAKARLAKAQARIVELEHERPGKLLVADGVEAVAALDKELEAQRHAVTVCRDQIVAFEAQAREKRYRERLRQKKAALVAIAETVAERDRIAGELEAAMVKVGELYKQFVAVSNRAISQVAAKPELFRAPAAHDMRADFVKQRISHAMSGRAADPAFMAQAIAGLAAKAFEQSGSWLAWLRGASLPKVEEDNEDTERAA